MDKKERAKVARRAREKKARDQLSDSYVRKLLLGKNPSGLKKSTFPKEMVETKRLQLTVRRIALGNESANSASEIIRKLYPQLDAPRSTQEAELKAKKPDK
jgi:hypothetical protein